MQPLNLHDLTAALVLIDLQEGILSFPLAPYTASQMVERANSLAEGFRMKQFPVFYVKAAMHEFAELPVDVALVEGPPPGNAALELSGKLNRQEGDSVIAKRQWGAFDGTDLDQQLRRKGIRTIVLGGVATNFGVESTARAAFDLGYQVVLAEDAMSTFDPQAHGFATGFIFPRLGRVRSTEQVLEALR